MRRKTQALAAVLLAGNVAAAEPPPEWVEHARTGTDALGAELKQALVSAMQENGPVAAIEVCRIRAPAIANRLSTGELDVGRTSLKVRNPGNAPDAWEAQTLAEFNRRIEQGEGPAQMEAFAIRSDGQRRYGHWMKAIPTQGLCTACHGTEIQPDVARAIDANYPEDEARGFVVGELRGAFSVEVELLTD